MICPYLWGLYIVFSPVNGCHYLILYDFISSTLPPNITSHCYPPKHYSWTLLSCHVVTCQEPCHAFELSVLYCQENHRSNLQFSIVVVELWSKFLFGSIKFCMRNLKANTQKFSVFIYSWEWEKGKQVSRMVSEYAAERGGSIFDSLHFL